MPLDSFYTGSMIECEPEPVDWVVENIAARGAVTLLYGRPGIGKSLLALALAGAMTGETSVGSFVVKRAPALLLDAENGEAELARRLHSLNFNGQCGKFFEAFTLPKGQPLDSPDTLHGLMWQCSIFKPQLIILDSLRTLWWNGDENSSTQITILLTALQEIAQECDTAIILLHHPEKSTGTARGSGALTAVPEISIRMDQHRRDKDATRRYLVWDKCRPASPPNRTWFRLQPGPLGIEIQHASRPTQEELWEE